MMELPEPRALEDPGIPLDWRARLFTVHEIERVALERTGRHTSAREFAVLVRDARAEELLRDVFEEESLEA